MAASGLEPDLTFFLDISVDESFKDAGQGQLKMTGLSFSEEIFRIRSEAVILKRQNISANKDS